MLLIDFLIDLAAELIHICEKKQLFTHLDNSEKWENHINSKAHIQLSLNGACEGARPTTPSRRDTWA